MAEEQPTVAPQANLAPQESQVTSQTPPTKPAKNPNRVAAGKATADKTRQAREAQKKALDEANGKLASIENAQAQHPVEATPEPTVRQAPHPAKTGLSTNEWLTLAGIGVALFTTYVKREDIQRFFTREPAGGQAPHPVEATPAPAVEQAPHPRVATQPSRNAFRPMD